MLEMRSSTFKLEGEIQMITAEIILGFPVGAVPASISVEEDCEFPTSDRFSELMYLAQREALEQEGFQFIQEIGEVFTMKCPDGEVNKFRKILELEKYFDADEGERKDAIVGVAVSSPFAVKRLTDWDDTPPNFKITPQKMRMVERFKTVMSAEFPDFAKAELYVVPMH